MYLVPKKLYDNFLAKSSIKTCDIVKQINNLDVNNGGSVVIHNEGEIGVKQSPINNIPPIQTQGSSTKSSQDSEEIINKIDSQPSIIQSNSLEDPPSPSITETSIPHNDIEPESTSIPHNDIEPESNDIFVLDKDGIKTDRDTLTNFEWETTPSSKTKDLFTPSSQLKIKMKRPRKKKFNRSYPSAPNFLQSSFLKRNLPPSAKNVLNEDLVSKNDVMKSDTSNTKDSGLTFDSDVRFDPESTNRLKVQFFDDNVAPIEDRKKSTKRKSPTSKREYQPSSKDARQLRTGIKRNLGNGFAPDESEPTTRKVKDPTNIRKRSKAAKNRVLQKKLKIDWDDE